MLQLDGTVSDVSLSCIENSSVTPTPAFTSPVSASVLGSTSSAPQRHHLSSVWDAPGDAGRRLFKSDDGCLSNLTVRSNMPKAFAGAMWVHTCVYGLDSWRLKQDQSVSRLGTHSHLVCGLASWKILPQTK